ncbi:bifunctional 4-hydroxy-3-methylbut-2-enyl diphosphate reductase/30S ribosomal protein S1 [Anaerolentibacter hominis]|uniref:bifunctional 4-hydroxy-3-methylbut-2-enyl diphosphate reductase/30S ribosomal protein S1 n=1 Tax=Anaerolentibacter hominis TaxID=3079009 RepID=UPI0031B8173D
MKVTVAQTAGFCFGVKRAVDMVYAEAAGGRKVYTLGPIIHNEAVVEEMEHKGVVVAENLDLIPADEDACVIIRSHGVGPEVYEALGKKGVRIADATCPFVKKIHKTVREAEERGEKVIIAGSRRHPEVEGIRSWCQGDAVILESPEEAEKFAGEKVIRYCLVAQTTFNYKKFKELVEILARKGYDIIAVNSICHATNERQIEAKQLASVSDAMVVIGGKNSSNTQKLFEICKKECDETYYIQTLSDLDLKKFKSDSSVGITAGASTPKNIIKEVHSIMSEMSFEQLLEESLVTIHNGEVVEGSVIDVKEDEIILNIGYKADGIITRNEYTNVPNLDLRTAVQAGDTMQAKVLKVNDGEGQVLLTYKRLAAEKGNKRLEEAYNNKEILKAKVSAVLDGGLSVVIDEARVFIPASLVSDTYEKNLDKYADQEIEFVISEFNPKRRRIIGDRKQLLVARKKEMQKELFERISIGMTVEGTVKNVTDFGAFIDLGGADGLLHISEMSWGRVENPKKVFKVGDKVSVLIKDIQGEKIALSMKFEDQNPWLHAAENYAVGNVVEGKVARMTDFGAFVELEVGVDALLHVSQISREHVEKPSDVLSIGQIITAKVVDFNGEDKKISLSMKALETQAAPAETVLEEEDAPEEE